METKPKSQIQIALTYGVILAFASIISSLLFYITGNSMSTLVQYIGFIFMIILIVLGIKNYRDKELGGYISYGRSLGTGVLISLVAGIIYSIYFFLYIKYIETDFIEKMLEKSREAWLDNGMSDEQIEKYSAGQAKYMTPVYMLIGAVVGNVFWGFLFSLIISIFTKKKNPSFEANFQ